MRGVLILLQPLDPATNTRTSIRVGQSGNSRTLTADGVQWHSAIVRAPQIVLDFMDVALQGGVQIGRANAVIDTKRIPGLTRVQMDNLVWRGAPVSIWSGDGALTSELTLEFVGRVQSGTIEKRSRALPLAMEVNRRLVDVPLLNQEYGGGGGADGDVEMRGQLKPAAFGKPVNVPVLFFDRTNNVGQIDAYGNVTAINELFEDAASFGTKQGDYATYAALVAATLTEGQWATSIAQGMIRLGAEPRGVITCDPICGAGTPGAMMLRWLQSHAAVSAGNIDSAAFTAVDSALATLLAHPAAVSYWTQSQVTVQDRMEAMCGSINATPFILPNGKVSISRQINPAAPVLTFQRFGGTPQVLDWRTMDPPEISWRLKSSAAVTWRVHSNDEIDYNDDLVDLGDHTVGTQYREGNIVRLPSNGVRYLYINATPGTTAPPAGTHWEIYEDAPDASVLTYVDGTAIEYLKPAEPNATKIVNRGGWAAATAYAKGDIVQYQGTSWFTNTAHTSNASFPPGHASNTQMTSMVNAVTTFLTNESATVATAVDGTGGSYGSAGGTFKVFNGVKDVTTGNGVVYSIVSQTSGLGLTLDTGTGVYAISAPTVDTGTATLRASYGGVSYDKIYSFAKSKAGSSITGPGGPVIALTSDAQAFKYVDNAASPASQTITLKAIRQNTGETVNWSTAPSVTLGTTADPLERTLTIANFGANRQVVVTATGATTGVKDTMTLVRLDQSTAEASATRNEDGANMIPSPLLFDRAEFGNGGYYSFDPAGNGRPITRYRAVLDNIANSYVVFESSPTAIPVIAGERIYAAYTAQGTGVTTDAVVGIMQFFDWQGIQVSQTVMSESNLTGTQTGGVPTVARGSVLVPTSGVAFARFYVQRTAVLQAGDFLIAEPYLGRQQQGADVTSSHAALGDGNRVRFSQMESGFRNWLVPSFNPSALTHVADVNKFLGKRYVRANTINFTAANQQFNIAGVQNDQTLMVRVTPGERLAVSAAIEVQCGANATWDLSVTFCNDAFGNATYPVVASGTGPVGYGTTKGGFVTVPALATFAAINLALINGTTTGNAHSILIAEPMITSAGVDQTILPAWSPGPSNEFGADVTTIVEGPAQSTEFNYDYLGTAAAGQFSRALTFKLNSAAGQITAGIVWTWKVVTGTVNGLTSASGVQSMSGAGTGTMTVSSLGADVSKVEVTATYLGAVRVKQFELKRNIASAPVGGGGGGGSTTLKTKTSGWSSFNTTTFVAISGSDFNGCTLPAGKTQFDVSASLSVEPDTGAVNGSWTVEVKWQRLIASVWTDIGSPAVASGSSSVTGLGGAEPEPVVNPASITCNKSETGLTAGSTHDLRLVARTTAAKLHYVNGSAAVVAP